MASIPQHGSALDATPTAWICGDLHLENFGSYKGDNRLVYFDINDFDEAARAPAAWDLARILSSLWTARKGLHLDKGQADSLSQIFLEAYRQELRMGKARWLERATAQGMIRDLLKGLKNRSRQSLIKDRTEPGGKRLLIDGTRTLAADGDSQTKPRLPERSLFRTEAQGTGPSFPLTPLNRALPNHGLPSQGRGCGTMSMRQVPLVSRL
ncbi:MAG: DUF2252 family protein [Cyanobacteriota bacterium]|nr:DUF2252 family protein [Cyanobacteriota bacterium]